MRVYHGSYTAIEKPEILTSKFPKDFGEGFYCTKLEAQAERWANRYDKALSTLQFLKSKTISNYDRQRK